MWTDVFQTVIILIGLSTVLAKGLMRVGGFTQMAEIAGEGGRLVFDDIDLRHRHSLWSATIGPSIGWLTPFFNQALVQRICSLKTLKNAKSTFSSGINALAANTVEDLLARPLKGYSDVIVTRIAKHTVWLYGAISIGLAYLIRNFSGPVTQMTSTVMSAFGTPAVAVFFLAAGFPSSNKYGAAGGAVIGCTVSLWLAIGGNLYGTPSPSLPPGPVSNCHGHSSSWLPANQSVSEWDSGYSVWNTTHSVPSSERTESATFSIYDLSYMWSFPIVFTTTILSGLLVSLLTGGTDYETLDPKCIFPVSRKIFNISQPEHEPEGTTVGVAEKEMKPLTERTVQKVPINDHSTTGDDKLTTSVGQLFDHYSHLQL